MRNPRLKPFWLKAEVSEWQDLWEKGVFKKWKRSYLLPNDRVFTQAFRFYGQCIFEGKKGKSKQAKGSHEDVSGGKHVVRARSWWKRGDVSACAAQTHMQCWVHRDTVVDEGQVEMKMREAWELKVYQVKRLSTGVRCSLCRP